MIELFVDNRKLRVEPGTMLLDACLDHGIYIPHLCHLKGASEAHASCRLCFVEMEGMSDPVPSCTVKVQPGMVVRTDTPRVRALQKRALGLLLSVHEVDCAHCPANKKCPLQDTARFLRVGLKADGVETTLKAANPSDAHPLITYHPNRCVLCARCIRLCRTHRGLPQMALAGRGFNTLITFFGTGRAGDCANCLACVQACPVAALTLRIQDRS